MSWSSWTPNSWHLAGAVFPGLFYTSRVHDLIYNNTWFPPMPWQGETPSSNPTDLAIVSRHIPVWGLRTYTELRTYIHERKFATTIIITENACLCSKREEEVIVHNWKAPACRVLIDNLTCLSYTWFRICIRACIGHIKYCQKILRLFKDDWECLKSSQTVIVPNISCY